MLQKEELLGTLNEGQRDAVDEIFSSTIKLERLIGDILSTQTPLLSRFPRLHRA